MSEWISIDERMPIEIPKEKHFVSKQITVIVTDGKTVGTCDCLAGSFPDFWVAFSSYGDVNGTDITHWQPLPEPPQ